MPSILAAQQEEWMKMRVFWMMLWMLCASAVVSGCELLEMHRPGDEQPHISQFVTPVFAYAEDVDPYKMQWDMIAPMLLAGDEVHLGANDPEECVEYELSLELDYAVPAARLDSHFACYIVPHGDWWKRDPGGVTVWATLNLPGHPENGATVMVMVKNEFDGWGYGPHVRLPDELGLLASWELDEDSADTWADIYNAPLLSSELITEGGAYKCNGEGICLYSLVALTHRNPTWTQAEIEDELKRTLGADIVVGIPYINRLDGNAVDDPPFQDDLDGNGVLECYANAGGTRGHVDVFLAFAGPDKLFISQMRDEDIRGSVDLGVQQDLDNIWTFIETHPDLQGLELIAFPEAGLIPRPVNSTDAVWSWVGAMDPIPGLGGPCEWTANGGVVAQASSYANFYDSGHVLILPTFRHLDPVFAARDQEARELLEEHLPGKTVVEIEADAANVGAGGPHCIVQEAFIPDGPAPSLALMVMVRAWILLNEWTGITL